MYPISLLLTIIFAAQTFAYLDILLPPYYVQNLTGSIPFNITLRTPDSSYRLYLALTPPGGGTNPVCVLNYTLPASTTQLNVTIPSDLGPKRDPYNGRYYSISASPLKRGRSSGFFYSSRFSLMGMTGGEFEPFAAEWQVGDSETLACTSLVCATKCAKKYTKPVLYDKSDATSDEKIAAWAKEKQCIKDECPGSDASEGAASSSLGPVGHWPIAVAVVIVLVAGFV